MKIPFYDGKKHVELDTSPIDVLHIHGEESLPNLTLAEVDEKIRDGLENPLEFAPLRECIMVGDQVVLPIAPGIPQGERIVRQVVDYLENLPPEHQPGKITLLQPYAGMLSPISGGKVEVEIVTHNPEKKEHFALLGVDSTGESLVLHRLLFDADVIFPIGVFQPADTTGYYGIHTPIYPLFSDAQTQRRYRFFGRQLHETQHEQMHQLQHEVAEVTRQSGVTLMLQVVPGIPMRGNSGVAGIFVGEYRQVLRDGYSLYRDLWTLLEERQPEVVLATITSESSPQEWENISRALVNASRRLEPGGVILLCADFPASWPISLEIYRNSQDVPTAVRAIHRQESPDAQFILDILPILRDYRIFFWQPEEAERWEEMNITPLENLEELYRLLRHSGTCLVLPDAHRMIL
ncbi:MAG: hypothetical protein Q4D62_04910 [Planctomycetia bacterium]|nr:hypothetical protein [Planctomycetia bacterium]